MEDRPPRPSVGGALSSEVRQPDVEQVAIGLRVLWLHARDDAELYEARDVKRRWRLDVLNAVAPLGRAGGERVERLPDRGVADRVHLDLPAAGVGSADCLEQLVGRPQRLATLLGSFVGL